MLGLYISVPVACFRKGMAREYFETELLPPPATCYGFLLSFVGETNRQRHVGCRVTATLIGKPQMSVVLRTVWRLKKATLGAPGNSRPDYQQLLSGIELVIWLDSAEEVAGEGLTLEQRVQAALKNPSSIERFGGLSLGESTHLVNDILPLSRAENHIADRLGRTFVVASNGRFTLPVWVDHVGSAGTRHATGNLVEHRSHFQPSTEEIPKIQPLDKI